MFKTCWKHCSISHWQETEGYSLWNWWRGVVSRVSPWSTYLSANHCTRGWGEHGHMTWSLPERMRFLDLLFLIAQGKVCTSIHKHCQWWDPAPCPESCGNEFRICWVLRSAMKHCFLALFVLVCKGRERSQISASFETSYSFSSSLMAWRFSILQYKFKVLLNDKFIFIFVNM